MKRIAPDLNPVAVVQCHIVLADFHPVELRPVRGVHIRQGISIQIRIEIDDAVTAAHLRDARQADCTLLIAPDESLPVAGKIHSSDCPVVVILQIRHKKSPIEL